MGGCQGLAQKLPSYQVMILLREFYQPDGQFQPHITQLIDRAPRILTSFLADPSKPKQNRSRQPEQQPAPTRTSSSPSFQPPVIVLSAPQPPAPTVIINNAPAPQSPKQSKQKGKKSKKSKDTGSDSEEEEEDTTLQKVGWALLGVSAASLALYSTYKTSQEHSNLSISSHTRTILHQTRASLQAARKWMHERSRFGLPIPPIVQQDYDSLSAVCIALEQLDDRPQREFSLAVFGGLAVSGAVTAIAAMSRSRRIAYLGFTGMAASCVAWVWAKGIHLLTQENTIQKPTKNL